MNITIAATSNQGGRASNQDQTGEVRGNRAGLILVGGAAALVGGRGYGDIHYASGLVCESLY